MCEENITFIVTLTTGSRLVQTFRGLYVFTVVTVSTVWWIWTTFSTYGFVILFCIKMTILVQNDKRAVQFSVPTHLMCGILWIFPEKSSQRNLRTFVGPIRLKGNETLSIAWSVFHTDPWLNQRFTKAKFAKLRQNSPVSSGHPSPLGDIF